MTIRDSKGTVRAWWRENMPDEPELGAKLEALLAHLGASPLIEHIDNLTTCWHVESDREQSWALVRVHNMPGCDYRGQQLALNIEACSWCAGCALGVMRAYGTRPPSREAFEAATQALAQLLHEAGREPSLELGFALFEMGRSMLAEYGRPKKGPGQ